MTLAWNTAADGSGTTLAVGATHTVDASVTLYAQWQTEGGGNNNLSITVDFDDNGIVITGDKGSNVLSKTGVKDRPTSLALSVDTSAGFTEVIWYLDGDTAGTSGNSITLQAANLGIQNHSVTFTGKKNGLLYSSSPIAFKVEP